MRNCFLFVLFLCCVCCTIGCSREKGGGSVLGADVPTPTVGIRQERVGGVMGAVRDTFLGEPLEEPVGFQLFLQEPFYDDLLVCVSVLYERRLYASSAVQHPDPENVWALIPAGAMESSIHPLSSVVMQEEMNLVELSIRKLNDLKWVKGTIVTLDGVMINPQRHTWYLYHVYEAEMWL